MPVKLTAESYLGLAVETVLGTPVASTGFIPILQFKPQDKPDWVDDNGRRGTPFDLFGVYASVQSSTYTAEGNFYPGSGGNILALVMGEDTVTGTTPNYVHTFGTATPGPSWTFGDYYVAGYRQWAGVRGNKLTVKFTPTAGVTYTLDGIGFLSETATAPTTQTFGTEDFFLGWQGSVSFGGTADAELESFEIDITRKSSEPIFAANNSQKPYDIFQGLVQCQYKMTFYMQNDDEYIYALSQDPQVVVAKIEQSTNTYLQFTSSKVQFKQPTIDRSKEYVLVDISGEAVYNSTDQSVVVPVLANSVSTAYTTTAAS